MTEQTARNAARHGVKKRRPMWVQSPWSGKWRHVFNATESKVDPRRVLIEADGCEPFTVPWKAKLTDNPPEG